MKKDVLISAVVLIALLFAFAGYMPMSGDLSEHFMLVDELAKHGDVRAGNHNLGSMSLYPPGSHWIASIIGRMIGSSLVGIIATSIVALFLCYRLIIRLIDDESIGAMLVFSVLYMLAASQDSVIGSELWVNFFFPQIVADVLFLGMLVWLAHDPKPWTVMIAVTVAGFVGMWIQPLIAFHMLGSAIAVLGLKALFSWKADPREAFNHIGAAIVIALTAVAMFLFHPSVQTMRLVSQNDGYLEFGYKSAAGVAIACALIALANLAVHIRRKTAHIDFVIAAATLSSVAFVSIQAVAFHAMHLGSPYAIKKHMFLVFTLGLINASRIIINAFKWDKKHPALAWIIAPVLAGLMCVSILRGYVYPIAPVEAAVEYAKGAAPSFKAGEVVANLRQPPMINFMISQAIFEHPFDRISISWMAGANPSDGAHLIMVSRGDISEDCVTKETGNSAYAIVKPSCAPNAFVSH